MLIHLYPCALTGNLFPCVLGGILLITSLAATAASEPSHNAGPVTAPGATLQKLAGGFAFTEGPSSDLAGNVFFTDQPNDRIMEWSIDGKLTTFLSPCGRSNGTCFDKQGNLWTCADMHNEVWRIAPDGKHTIMLAEYNGKLLNGPNDIWIRPDGGAYLTDPLYPRDYWTRTKASEQPGEYVYYLSPDGKSLRPVDKEMVKPNGIVGTADGKTLYVADIRGNKTYSYHIQPNGDLTGKQLFCEMGSDGMTIDDAGNLYLTGHGVTIFNKRGQQIEHIPVDEKWTGNVCFGGAAHDTLFITASEGFYCIKMRTRGVGSE